MEPYAAIDLRSNNRVLVVLDAEDRTIATVRPRRCERPGSLDSDDRRGSIRRDAGNVVRCRRDGTRRCLAQFVGIQPEYARVHLTAPALSADCRCDAAGLSGKLAACAGVGQSTVFCFAPTVMTRIGDGDWGSVELCDRDPEWLVIGPGTIVQDADRNLLA
jgi:hypothetical protein